MHKRYQCRRWGCAKNLPQSGRWGLSVLEMLAMLTIILILLGAFSGLAQMAYRLSLSAKSEANLRTLAQANLMYAADHDGYFCPAQEPRNLVRWHGGRTSIDAKFDPTKGFLYPYLMDGGRCLTCPVLSNYYPESSQTFELGAGGYGYNEMYIGGTPKSQFKAEKMNNVTNPSHTIMFTDTCLPRADGVQEYPFSEPYYSVNPNGAIGAGMSPSVHFRHNGLAHVAWCDGAVTAEHPALIGGVNPYGGDDARSQVGWVGPSADNGWWNSRQTPP